MADDDICEVRITAANLDWLAAHTRTLIEDRLVACGQHETTVRSLYRWEGSIADEPEARVALHTRRQRVPEIIARTTAAHPDDVAGIIVVPVVDGNPPYLQWVRDETAAVPPSSPR